MSNINLKISQISYIVAVNLLQGTISIVWLSRLYAHVEATYDIHSKTIYSCICIHTKLIRGALSSRAQQLAHVPQNSQYGTSLQECHYAAQNDRDIIINRDRGNLGDRGTPWWTRHFASYETTTTLILSIYLIKTRIRAESP